MTRYGLQVRHTALPDFGAYAMNSMRMEKAYRGMGAELTNEITMVEADMERFVKLDKEFTGKAATEKSKQDGPRIQLVYMTVDAKEADALGNEPVYANGEVVGVSTGGAYGYAVGTSLAFAYVKPEFVAPGTELSIKLMENMCPCKVVAEPVWDPKSERPRA